VGERELAVPHLVDAGPGFPGDVRLLADARLTLDGGLPERRVGGDEERETEDETGERDPAAEWHGGDPGVRAVAHKGVTARGVGRWRTGAVGASPMRLAAGDCGRKHSPAGTSRRAGGGVGKPRGPGRTVVG